MTFDDVIEKKSEEDKMIKEIGELWKQQASMEYIRKNYPNNVISKFLKSKGKVKDYND